MSIIRPQDRAGRFGGDEFVVILPDVQGANEVIEIADRIRREVGGRYTISSGIGAPPDGDRVRDRLASAWPWPSATESPEELLRDADAAMYEAKARGRDRVQLFDGAMRLQVVERLDIEQAPAPGPRARTSSRVHYQPVVDLTTRDGPGRSRPWCAGSIPTRGLLLPGQFLPVAEETGLIVDIGTLGAVPGVRAGRAPGRRDDGRRRSRCRCS